MEQKTRHWLKILMAGTLMFIGSVGALLWYGCNDRIIPADVAVVLGNQVYSNGQPSPRLAARLDKSVELYKAGLCRTIIVSGGTGQSKVDEAVAMGVYLQAKGVPGWAVVVDSQGHNTWQTAQFTAGYLKKHHLKSVNVISQHFHLHRSVMALKAAGCENVGRAAPDYWEQSDFFSIAREVPANFVYWWKYCISGDDYKTRLAANLPVKS